MFIVDRSFPFTAGAKFEKVAEQKRPSFEREKERAGSNEPESPESRSGPLLIFLLGGCVACVGEEACG